MGAALIIAIVIGIAAVLVSARGGELAGGMSAEQFALLAWCAALGVVALGWVSRLLRTHGSKAFQALVIWAGLMAALVGLYTYRVEIGSLSFLADVSPGTTETAAGGEVNVSRRAGGDFIVSGKVNGHDARFLFDTGASTVVLTPETAQAVGIDASKLNYVHVVTTANGRALAAAVVLDRGHDRQHQRAARLRARGAARRALAESARHDVSQPACVLRGQGRPADTTRARCRHARLALKHDPEK